MNFVCLHGHTNIGSAMCSGQQLKNMLSDISVWLAEYCSSSALTIIRWKQIATMITIISNILPSAIGALADQGSTETDKTSDSEVQNSEGSVEQDASAK